MYWKLILLLTIMQTTIAYHSEFFRPTIMDRGFSYVQGLTCNDNSLLLGTNSGAIVRIGKNPRGGLEQKEIVSIARRNIQKIHANDDFIVARADTDDFTTRPFGGSIIMKAEPLRPMFRLNHDLGNIVYDAIIGACSYLTVYFHNARRSTWNSSGQLHDVFYSIKNLGAGEHIHLAYHTEKRLYVMTSSGRFGWLDDVEYAFHELHHIPFLGMTTAIHVKQLREDTIFVYIGTSTGMIYFLQFNGVECVIRNQIQISQSYSAIAQISSTNGNSVYASTVDCQIVGFNMISFEIVFDVKTGYDQFRRNTDNFILKRNSVITYDNKERIVCYIL